MDEKALAAAVAAALAAVGLGGGDSGKTISSEAIKLTPTNYFKVLLKIFNLLVNLVLLMLQHLLLLITKRLMSN